MDLPEITEVKRLAVRPGDRIVLRLDRTPSLAEADEIGELVRLAFEGLDYVPPVLVLGPGEDIEIVGPEADGT